MNNDPIATREYEIVDEGGLKSPFKLFLFTPFLDKEDWCCKVEVHERGSIWNHEVKGIDSLQALNLAISVLKTEVFAFQKKFNGKLLFLDQKEEIWV